MSDNDLFKRLVDAGVAFTEMSRQRAEQIVGDLSHRGEASMEEMQASVEHLVERSRVSTERLIAMVRDEVIAQLRSLGLVPPAGTAPVVATVVDTAPAKQAAARKAPAKKAAPRKAPATKAAPRKAATRKAPVRKAAARKAPATKAAPRKAATTTAAPRKAPTKRAATRTAAPRKAPAKRAATSR